MVNINMSGLKVKGCLDNVAPILQCLPCCSRMSIIIGELQQSKMSQLCATGLSVTDTLYWEAHILTVDDTPNRGQGAVRVKLSRVCSSWGIPQPVARSVVRRWRQHIRRWACKKENRSFVLSCSWQRLQHSKCVCTLMMQLCNLLHSSPSLPNSLPNSLRVCELFSN